MTQNNGLKIGLEIHAQMNSLTKLFSTSRESVYDSEDSSPNANATPYDMGYPGTLPRLSEECLKLAILTGYALNCEINLNSSFDRKHYFYPDSPFGYQVTQQYSPICLGGYIEITNKKINLHRIHMEADAGKMIHQDGKSYLNYNRSGAALMEIVTQPELRSPEEACEFVNELILILRHIKSCNCNMENGELRFDVNISLYNGNRVEIKNLNSVKFMREAIIYEIKRQESIYALGQKIDQETRLFNSITGETKLLRSKENMEDYRYIQDKNLPTLKLSEEYVNNIRKTLPELPSEIRKKYKDINSEALSVLLDNLTMYDLFLKTTKEINNVNFLSNLLASDVRGLCNSQNILLEESKLKSDHLIEICKLMEGNKISIKIAKECLEQAFINGESPISRIKSLGLEKINNEEELEILCNKIINNNSKEKERYMAGETKLLEFFVGQAMKETRGKADVDMIRNFFITLLK